MFFFSKKKSAASPGDGCISYDRSRQEPVIRCSICTGEQVAGFCDKATGSFTEVMLIKNSSDLETFCQQYGVQKDSLRKIY